MRQPGRPAGPAGVQALKTGSREGTMADRFILMDNARGADCAALRTALVRALGPAATGYADLATGDDFSTVVKGALARWQAEAGLVADGICGPC